MSKKKNEERFIIGDIVWNKHHWQLPYPELRSGHRYITEGKGRAGHDSLNFDFNKNVDDNKYVFGYVPFTGKSGVPFTAYFMTGFPGETDKDLKETIEFAKQIEADYYSLSVLAPYYGTEIYNSLIEDGHELEKKPWEYFFHQSPDLMVNENISEKMLKEYLSLNELNENKKVYV